MDDDARKSLESTTRYDPSEVERRIFERWDEGGYFHPEPVGESEDNFSIAVPPPNVTGVLHMGHALNGSIQDSLIRLNRMRGKPTRWIMGTDHAGIATQAQVEKELAGEGTSRRDIGREAFVERVWAWRERHGSQIIEQFKRLGASADYSDERFTMDDAYARAVTHVFVELHSRGHIYRDNYMVNWDPGLGSAISDLEVEQKTLTDTLFSIDYPLADGSGSITVATVRPETMLGDTAVAVHPDDERYASLVGAEVILPLVGRRLPVIADEYVKPEFGTGALKITPGHDPNDFDIGRRHGLEEISVIGEDGLMTEAAGERFAGLDPEDARKAIVSALRDEGLISGEEPYKHEVPHSARSGRRVEPLISLQWFCDMTELAKPAIEVVRSGQIKFHPERSRQGLSRLAREHPAVVRLAPALVGPPASRLVLRRVRGDLRRRSRSRALRRLRRRAAARRRRAGHLVLLRRSGRSRRLDGPRRRLSFAPGIRPMSSRRRGTSSSSGWPAW